MTEQQIRGFDADNHYYEALDAFTRHIEPEFSKRCMQWMTIDGKWRLLVGGRLNRFLANPTFDRLGLSEPLDYLKDIERAGLGPAGRDLIIRENAVTLVAPASMML